MAIVACPTAPLLPMLPRNLFNLLAQALLQSTGIGKLAGSYAF
jgi:hypothetical protein